MRATTFLSTASSLCMNNVLLNECCFEIPQRSLDETLSVSCILSLEMYARSRTVAIIKQLQFHMAGSFEIVEEKGGGKSSVVKKNKCANIDVPFFPLNARLSSWACIPDHKNIACSLCNEKWLNYSAHSDDF